MLAINAPGVLFAVWSGAACIAVAVAVVTRELVSKLAFALAVGLLGAGLASQQLGPPGAASFVHEVPAHDEPPMLVEVEGLITDRPVRYTPATGALSGLVPRFMQMGERLRFTLSMQRIRVGEGWQEASGVLSVWVDAEDVEGELAHKGGDFVRIVGSLSAVRTPANPGERDRTLQNRDMNRVGSLSTSSELITPATMRSSWLRSQSVLIGLRSSIQLRAAGIIDSAVAGDERAGPVIRGLLLGRRGTDENDVVGAFQRVGLLHLLSVSGFHVAVAAGLALIMIRLTGDRGWVEPLVVCLAMGLYVMIVPMRAPIFRAALIVLVVLAGDAMGRRHDRISVIAWLAIAWLAFRPSDLFSLGFQLSFGLTCWLLVLSEPRRDTSPTLDEPTRVGIAKSIVLSPVRTSAACWSLAAPAILFHVGIVSPLAVLATVVTVPLIIVAMWFGFIVLVLGAAVPALAPMAAVVLRGVAGAASDVAIWFDSLTLATVSLGGVSMAWVVAATAAVAWIWRRAKLRDPRWIAVVVVLFAWLGVEQYASTKQGGKNAAQIHMLDVGDASAVLVQSGGQSLLWDCGSWMQDVGATLIPNACKALGSARVDTVVITHANIDHYMGVLDVAELLGVKVVITGESFGAAAARDPDGAPAFVLAELHRLGIEHRVVARGDVITLGDAALRVVHPPAGFVPRAENDASLVAMFEPADVPARALLTGDIQREAMAMLMESGQDLSASVLELPHHGSAHDAAYAFALHVNPRVVLQSTGMQRLDDPRWDHVRAGRSWFTTQRTGCVSVSIRTDGAIVAEPFR